MAPSQHSKRRHGSGPTSNTIRRLDGYACIDYIDSVLAIEAPISTLIIRNVEPRLKETLRVRAAKNGRSMEAELREIVRTALKDDLQADEDLFVAIRRHVDPVGGVELPEHPDEPTSPPRLG